MGLIAFRVELRNRYSELYNENAYASEQYEALVQANEHAAKTTLPLVKKSRRERFSNSPSVVKARKQVLKLERMYKISKSTITRKHLTAAKQKLNEEYNCLEN